MDNVQALFSTLSSHFLGQPVHTPWSIDSQENYSSLTLVQTEVRF